MSRYDHRCEVCAGAHVPEPCCYGCRCGTTHPPTMDDVLLCVAAMRGRVECGHSTPDQAMARLSLAMTDVLLAELTRAHDRGARATRRLIELRQAIPTLDHETTMDAVARLLRERDEAMAMAAVGKRAAQFARGLRAPAARAAALRLRSVVDVMRAAAGEVAVERTPSDDGRERER